MNKKLRKNTGTLLLIAYPENFVAPSTELICSIIPYLGIGTKDFIKAGHAALCLIENETGNIEYYDFGRYITPVGHGRVRSSLTDHELRLHFNACFNKNEITNLEEILLWIRNNSEKTGGKGDFYASILSEVSYLDAHTFIQNIHNFGSIPYGIFVKEGSNCARFVADTIIESTTNEEIRRSIKRESIITPSPLGIVKKGRSSELIYFVEKNTIKSLKTISSIQTIRNLFEKKNIEINPTKEKVHFTNKHSQYLDGQGYGAYFEIKYIDEDLYSIRKYHENEPISCEGTFKPTTRGFDITKKYTFIYDSNCSYCTIKQDESTYRFERYFHEDRT